MKRKSKPLTLLLAATLACTNMSIVYAATASSTEVSAVEESVEETFSENSSGGSSVPETESGQSAGEAQALPAAVNDISDVQNTEQETPAETVAEDISSEQNTVDASLGQDTGDASLEQNAEDASLGQDTEDSSFEQDTGDSSFEQDAEDAFLEQDTEDASTEPAIDESVETLPDPEPETEEDSTGTYINNNGETILPSDLIGVDYMTIVDAYDGAANVIKQYQPSDSCAVNTVMESYIDESGNLILVISQGIPETETAEPEPIDTGSFFSISSPAPAVDGNFSGWDGVPTSYEYNWDNSSNCWQYGCWTTDPTTGEQICYTTEEGSYDSNVRHEMQLYCDDTNVYLRIKYASIYESYANGDDFNFYIDGVGAKFALTWADGTPITGTNAAAGTYVIDIRNGDSASSYSIVDGASAYYYVTDNGVNNELELCIPLEALQAQNGGINLNNFSMIEFFTPNLMYRSIAAAGSPTGSVPFAAAAFLGIPASYVWLKKKTTMERAFT